MVDGFELGPHMSLVGAMVKLARRDLNHPVYRHQARAFLRGDLYADRLPGVNLDLFAALLGYDGSWEAKRVR